MTVLLEVRDLRTLFAVEGGGEFAAVDGVGFTLDAGRTLGIVGESGCGKSVTALSIMGLVAQPPGRIGGGSIAFDGVDLLQLSPSAMRELRGDRISMIFQEPMTSLNPAFTIGDQIVEGIVRHRPASSPSAKALALEMLRRVHIPSPEERFDDYPHRLSGGMRQRVMIAMALACKPALLIADEPTTALDVTVQAQILKLLKDIQTQLGMSMLFITHDLGIVRKLADRVCVMQRGKIVEQGEVERVFTAPEHPYTRALLAAEPKPDPALPRPDAPIVIETKDLKVWFPVKRGVMRKVVGHIKAVDGVSIELRKGETLGVVGESGSGKTTLGLAILRLISSTGPIVFMGHAIEGLKFKQMRPFRHDMQIVFQDPYGSLSPRMAVSDIVEEGLWVHHPGLSRTEREQRVVAALNDVGLDPATKARSRLDTFVRPLKQWSCRDNRPTKRHHGAGFALACPSAADQAAKWRPRNAVTSAMRVR